MTPQGKKPILPPATNPCGSCPYRCDVPSGIWHPSEYAKLPEFDNPTMEQPRSVFLCHQNDGHLCAGWVAVHDMSQSLGLRIALSTGTIQPEHVDAILDYTTATPLFGSGQEAMVHGMCDVRKPKRKAVETQRKILSKRTAQ